MLHLKFLIKLLVLIIGCYNNYCYATTTNNSTNKYHKLQVKILGIPPKLAETIQQDLLIFQAINEHKLTKNRIENLHDKAKTEIIHNLQSLGYYHVAVKNITLQETSQNQWLASYEIELGRPTIINQLDLQLLGEATNNLKLSQEINQLSVKFLHKDQQLNHDEYEKTKQYILNKLYDYGFLNAKFDKSTITINPNNYTASILLIIDSKQQYYLGAVTFESDRYTTDFLKSYVTFKEHNLYSRDALMQLKNNLLNSGLFSKIRIDTPNIATIDNNIIPITVRTYAKPANNYSGSIGFGTDTGIRGSLGYSRKRINHPGHQINLNIMGSKIRKNATADYSILGTNPIIDKYNFGITGTEETIEKRFNQNAAIYIQKTKKLANKTQFWKLNFLTEAYKELPEQNKQYAKFIMPSLRLIWVHKPHNQNQDNNIGNKLDITTKFAHKSLASSTLLQITIQEKWIKPLIYDINIILKGTLGCTYIKGIKKLPLSLRFFAGGDYSIRGYAYESLGPTITDKNGNQKVIGGKHLILTSFELEKPIYNQINAGYFIDLGNALNTFNKLNFNKLAFTNGLGLIYKTPIGSVRAYVAKPLKTVDHVNKKSLRFHLTFDAGLQS